MAPERAAVELLFCSTRAARLRGGHMKGQRSSGRVYKQPVIRDIDLDALATITDADADSGEDDGLEGNQQYCDIRFIEWSFVAEALKRESQLFDRFSKASDLNEEEERYREELEAAILPEEDFWGLDIGVIGAVLALSAMGALTVSSCNAGGFGGRHVEQFPLIAMYLPRQIALDVLGIAEQVDVGLDMLNGGLVRLYGRTDYDLHKFGQAALSWHLNQGLP